MAAERRTQTGAAPGIPADAGPPAPPASTGDRSAALQAENDLLRQRLRQLEEENQRLRQALAEVEAERDDYRRAVYAYLRKEEGTPEQEFKEEDYTLSAEEVLTDLEKLIHGRLTSMWD
jgi:hypothetical protein